MAVVGDYGIGVAFDGGGYEFVVVGVVGDDSRVLLWVDEGGFVEEFADVAQVSALADGSVEDEFIFF